MPHFDGRVRASCGCCFIIPPATLRRWAAGADVPPELRDKLSDTFAETQRLQQFREASRFAALMQRGAMAPAAATLIAPVQRVFDCQGRQSLPGAPIPNPAGSADHTAAQVFAVTAKVAEFYETVLGRNSVDNQGLDLVSSVHYRVNFDNAFWNGQQMVYGDGDGDLFLPFGNSPDVVGHELTHGVTQYESGLAYQGESGALNESVSDVFGVTFNQWLNNWDVTQAQGWLVGAGIMGPRATGAGKTCLRDMVDPGNAHCLSPQPGSYRQYDPAGDVHSNSGIPNKAYAVYAGNVGGNSWDRAINVWYAACTSRALSSNATIPDFAAITLQASITDGSEAQMRDAWRAVDVMLAGV